MASREKRQRGVHATEEGKGLLKLAQGQLRQENGRKATYDHLAEQSQLDQSTVGRFFRGGKVDEDSARVICQILSLDYSKVVDCKTAFTPALNEDHALEARAEGNWPAICRIMLERHRRLTTNEWLAQPDSHFEVDDVHMPLALLERRLKERRSPRSDAAQGIAGYEASEIQEIQQFTHADFLNTILRDGEGRTHGQRVALIGEPGAGKTTLLQKIAFWILDNQLGLPIWISLADLQLRNNRLEDLGDYLSEVWLKRAVGLVTPEMKEDFFQRVQQGQVWLLLDGLDELSLPFASALRQMRDLLQGWISATRVILTCRVNVWEASLNALDQFETYRIGSFSPEQMQGFIQKWFAQQNPNQAEKLWQALNDSRNTRIRDLVKSPLRLTLLCSTWQEDTALPETKAALYECFVKALYRWKSDRFSISRADRKALDKALGELAKHAIDRGQSAYRLTQQQLDTYLDERTQRLCLELGWLNSIGVAEENKIEELFTFIHPTFQEYFAALAIDDSDFFFDPDNSEITKRSYRIFESRWREPLLIWFGLNQIEKLDKEALLRKLIYFEDECGKFYEYRACFVAALCLTEFPGSEYSQEILDQVYLFAFGCLAENGRGTPYIADHFNWIQYRVRHEAVEKIKSGEVPVHNSIQYIHDLLDRMYQYWYYDFIFSDEEKSAINPKINLLKIKKTTLNQTTLSKKFESEIRILCNDTKPGYIQLHLALQEISKNSDSTIDLLSSKLRHLHNLFIYHFEKGDLWDFVSNIDDYLHFAFSMANLLVEIDPKNEIGLAFLEKLIFCSTTEDSSALICLYYLLERQDSPAGKNTDPALLIAYYLFASSKHSLVEFYLLDAALMIASILQEREQDLVYFLEQVYRRFEFLNSDVYLKNKILETMLKYIESCCNKDEILAISLLEEMKTHIKENGFHESLDFRIAEIKSQDSTDWWRMETSKEKEKRRSEYWSSSPDHFVEDYLAAMEGDDRIFLHLLSHIDNFMLGSNFFVSMLNENRCTMAITRLKKNFLGNKEIDDDDSLLSWLSKSFSVLFHCAENMPYEQFLAAWQNA